MQAIILAAGVSRRLRPLTDTTPKCLLEIGGSNILQRMIENILHSGIDDFVFVTGYRQDMIRDFVNAKFPQIRKRFLINPDYDNNNNSYSLWMTKDVITEDAILLDSDIIFDGKIIDSLLSAGHENCLAVNSSEEPDEEQIKVKLDAGKRILQIGKHVPLKQSAGESIGIEKFSSYFMKGLFAILDRKISKENNVNEFYEASFQEVINSGEKRNSIYAVDVSEFMCMEIDTPEDYNKAQKIFNSK